MINFSEMEAYAALIRVALLLVRVLVLAAFVALVCVINTVITALIRYYSRK